MDEQDIMARLSRALDSQSVALTEDGPSTADMIHQLSRHIGGHGDPGDQDGYEDYIDDPPIELPNRRTPYEVWAAKHEVVSPVKTPKVMRDDEWDGLVERLHGTKRSKESTIKQQQNRELAEQLRELKFKPTLNKKSRSYASDTNRVPLEERVQKELEVREKYLNERREEKKKELDPAFLNVDHKGNKKNMTLCVAFDKGLNGAMVHSTRPVWPPEPEPSEPGKSPKPFTPTLQGSKRSEKVLKQARKSTSRSVQDILQYGEEAKLRRLQRKQIMEELDSRELTFAPQLNRASLMLQEKMRKEGRSMYNKASGQTETRQRVVKGGTGTSEDPGHEEEVFQPRISSRASSFKCPTGKNVYARLYDQGMEASHEKHNEQVEIFDKYLSGMQLKKTETTVRANDGNAATWVQDRKLLSQKGKEKKSLSESNLNVLEYSEGLDFILERLNAAQAAHTVP